MDNPLLAYLVSPDNDVMTRLRKKLIGKIECCIFSSARECQSELAKRRPDLVVIDLSLPSDEGFLLHRSLRDDFDFSDLYQILLGSPDDIERPDFAPDDFLLYPIAVKVLQQKLKLTQKVFEDKAAAKEQLAYAQNVAFTSMSSMGELGVVMQFLSKSFSCHNVQSVASLATESIRQYELEGGVYLVWEGDHHGLSTSDETLSEDMETFIEQRRTLGRLLEIDRNLIVNYEHVSLLITNLPENDLQRLGRIRDNVVTLAEGIESRVQGLLLEHDNLLKQQGIQYAVNEIRDSVANLDKRQQADLLQASELVNSVIDGFENGFMHMGLHAHHENQLIEALVDLRHNLGEIVRQPGEVHEKLKIVVAALQTLAGEVQH
jgi:CheY-like chemotaxis protein